MPDTAPTIVAVPTEQELEEVAKAYESGRTPPSSSTASGSWSRWTSSPGSSSRQPGVRGRYCTVDTGTTATGQVAASTTETETEPKSAWDIRLSWCAPTTIRSIRSARPASSVCGNP
jgi:hypothetical protein